MGDRKTECANNKCKWKGLESECKKQIRNRGRWGAMVTDFVCPKCERSEFYEVEQLTTHNG